MFFIDKSLLKRNIYICVDSRLPPHPSQKDKWSSRTKAGELWVYRIWDRDADSEVGQGSVKSTVFSKGQWLVLYTAHGMEEGLQFKLSRSSCKPPCCSPCGWRWWRSVNAPPLIGRWSVARTLPTFQEPPGLCLCRQGGQTHLERRGQRISQLTFYMSITQNWKWDKHQIVGRKEKTVVTYMASPAAAGK